MKTKGLLFIFLFAFCCLKAQTNYLPGYIVTLSGDTVSGQIDSRNSYKMGRICRFRSNDGVTEYKPNEIQSFRFADNSRYYVSKTIDGHACFFEYLFMGEMNVYYLEEDLGSSYYIEKEDFPLKKIPYKEEIRIKDDYKYLYQSTTHIGILNYATKDVPRLQKLISTMKVPNRDDLILIAKKYHNAIHKSDENVIFEKTTANRVQAEPFAGYFFGLRKQNNPEKIALSSGFLFGGAAIYIPSLTNGNWYFKTGVLYSHLKSSNVFIAPVQISYMYPKGKYRPVFSGGVNAYIINYFVTKESQYDGFEFLPRPSYSVGLLRQFNERTSLSVNIGLDTDPLMFGKISSFILPSHKLIGLTTLIGVRHTF